MRKYFLSFLSLIIFSVSLKAATYRNLSIQTLSGNTLTLWVDSDTVLGENTDAELKYDSGGSTLYFWTNGTYNTSTPGANWQIVITIPNGATNVSFQLANKNQSGSRYGFTGFIYSPLSVENLNFHISSNNHKNNLLWSTASETNNDYFEILHSSTGKDFHVIGMVKGAGTSNTMQQYRFTHENPARGRSYYRLRQVDYDGKYEYSPVRSVVSDLKKKDIQIAPNPATDHISIIYDGSSTGFDMTIRDITGRTIANYKNYNGETLDISDISYGSYTITIVAGGVSTTQRLVKL
jgi:hypothetical protein